MESSERHLHVADASFDGGNLDCGNGLLLLIRRHIDPLAKGGLLEIRSTEISVDEELPAWCRLTGNELVSWTKEGRQRSFLVCKGTFAARDGGERPSPPPTQRQPVAKAAQSDRSVTPARPPTPQIPTLAVMGMGSWPRPRWMLEAVHAFIEGRVDEAAFHETADDAARLAVAAQERAGVNILTDGEQRRDSYASFVATRLENCQLIPLIDLLPLVDDPEEFQRELRALDVPAADVRHPALFGRLARTRPLAVHELNFVQTVSSLPVKIALPGPYLLTRTMWLECLSERAYATREELAADVVSVLRAEIEELLEAGATVVQLDEPVLSEVVYAGAKNKRSFMCGALSESRGPEYELGFARDLMNAVIPHARQDRIAIHVCRGNWTPDERVALAGSYAPLVETLAAMNVGAYLLEMCTPRAGDIDVLRRLPSDARIGVGVVNQKNPAVDAVEDVAARIGRAVDAFGHERVLLHPDCGFATFADNPICASSVAEAKLRAIAQAADRFRP